jgi:hypothetical protein
MTSESHRYITYSPLGERYCFVFISLIKRLLAQEMSASYRLKFLEWLEKESRDFGEEVVSTIQRMCDDGYQMVKEAQKLGAKKSLDVFAQSVVFTAFVTLNPSLLAAIKLKKPFLPSNI